MAVDKDQAQALVHRQLVDTGFCCCVTHYLWPVPWRIGDIGISYRRRFFFGFDGCVDFT
jgi:hypothetical protein